MTRNLQVIFNEIPKGQVVKEQHLKNVESEIDLENVPLNGGVLVKTLVLSLDPYQRGRMRPAEVQSYVPAFELKKPITNFAVLRVLRSEHSDFKEGERLYHSGANFQEFDVLAPEALKGAMKLDEMIKKHNVPIEQWIGGAGMPGKTASFGFYEIGKPKKGETIFISSAAGAVGQVVGQLAKAEGLFVIGSAGSDDKCEYLKTIGFDHTINYKKQSIDEELTKLGKPIDINFENVGADTLDTLLKHMNTRGRVILCGLIAQYNGEAYGYKNITPILTKQLTIRGFIILYEPQWNETFYKMIPEMISNGKLNLKEDITEGLENAQDAFIGLLAGKNMGKAIIRVAKDEPTQSKI